MWTLGSNESIMLTLNTKQIIHLSGPEDETSFFAQDRLILVLGQKGDLTTRFPQIIGYARVPLKYTNMHLFTDNFTHESYGVNQYPTEVILRSSDHVLPPEFLVFFAKFTRI